MGGQPDAKYFALVVSLDDPASLRRMQAVAANYSSDRQRIETWEKPPDPSMKTTVQKIAAHFRFALTQTFDVNHYEYGVFIENDLSLSPDALWYFRASAWLLEEDESLFCVSAWNDNGFGGLVSDEKRLFRTDYFPGLGWMIRRDTWDKVKGIWPKNPTTGWDHWLRHGSGLRPRECIIPEVPRTHHFDEKGTNVKKGTGIHKLLSKMAVSKLPPGQLGDLSYLLKDTYENSIRGLIQKAETKKWFQLSGDLDAELSYVVPYKREEYKDLARRLDLYAGQARTAHRGIVMTRHPQTHAQLILVDRRQSADYLSEEDQLRPNAQRKVGPAKPGQSCTALCRAHQMQCSDRELEYVNRCSMLKKYFACENGCGHQVGLEIPAYVHSTEADTALQCLVTDEAAPTCKAHHKFTSRMCVRVPDA